MSEIPVISGMGITSRMRDALHAITEHVALHGAMPSRRTLAAALRCNPTNATRLMHALIERGELNNMTAGGPLTGFGRDGVAVFVPAHVAASLATFCVAHSEKITAVVADAIALHIDLLGGDVTGEGVQ